MSKLTIALRPHSIDEVLTFWFDDSGRWWKKDPAFDAELRDRFLDVHDAVVRDEREDWFETSRRMFESDPRALAAARRGLDGL
jgi:uncharacterized protein (DUF924 family)